METLGKRIALFRHMHEWTQERLASEVGITQSTLSDIETDKTSPSWDLINKFADALEVPAFSLLPNQTYNVLHNQFSDNASSIIHQYKGNFEEERKVWEQLLKAKDEIIAAKDKVIEVLEGKKV